MEKGRTFYLCLFCGLVALALLLVNANLPAQLVFETRPYARIVLASGKLNGWTAEKLGLDPAEFEMVKNNYAEYLKLHKTEDDSDSDDDDSSDSELMNTYVNVGRTTEANRLDIQQHMHDRDDKDYDNARKGRRDDDDDDDDDDDNKEEEPGDDKKAHQSTTMPKPAKTIIKPDASDSSESSETSDEDSDDSDEEVPLERRLEDAPMRRTVGIGLFHAKICDISQLNKERCYTVPDNEAIMIVSNEASFMKNDINMLMWNNLRVETLFAMIACILGLVFLLASLRPCCDNHRLPVYLGALSFFACGVLIFIPMVRLLLIRSDFAQNLVANMNITTKLMTSLSLLASGIAAPFALMASFSLIATKWYRFSKTLYHNLKTNQEEPVANGKAVAIGMVKLHPGNTQVLSVEPESIYENMEQQNRLLNGKVDKKEPDNA